MVKESVVNKKNMSVEEQKEYNRVKAEERKTNTFFVTSAVKRTNAVLKSLNRLIYMSRYNGTDEQKANILTAIDEKVAEVKTAFNKTKTDKNTFEL